MRLFSTFYAQIAKGWSGRPCTGGFLQRLFPFYLQVRVYDLHQYEHGADDVLILATDGLWDVLLNEEVAEAVTNFLPNCDPDDPHRYNLICLFFRLSQG